MIQFGVKNPNLAEKIISWKSPMTWLQAAVLGVDAVIAVRYGIPGAIIAAISSTGMVTACIFLNKR